MIGQLRGRIKSTQSPQWASPPSLFSFPRLHSTFSPARRNSDRAPLAFVGNVAMLSLLVGAPQRPLLSDQQPRPRSRDRGEQTDPAAERDEGTEKDRSGTPRARKGRREERRHRDTKTRRNTRHSKNEQQARKRTHNTQNAHKNTKTQGQRHTKTRRGKRGRHRHHNVHKNHARSQSVKERVRTG